MTTSTASMTTGQINDIACIVRGAMAAFAGHAVISQRQCVDVLLDLYNASDSVDLRSAVCDQLSGIRVLGAVLAAEMRACLETIVELATTRGAIDLEWAEQLLAA